MLSLELFVNDKYKLLKFLYDNQIQVKENYYVTLSQQEIADILHFSKLKTNNIIKELRKNNFIDTYNNKRGKYIITGKGCKVIEIIKKNTWFKKEMNKEDLKRVVNITSNIVSRMSKNAYVNLDSIEKICLALDCRIEDVVEIIFGRLSNDISEEWGIFRKQYW